MSQYSSSSRFGIGRRAPAGHSGGASESCAGTTSALVLYEADATNPIGAGLDVGEVVVHALDVSDRERRTLHERDALGLRAVMRVVDTLQRALAREVGQAA